MTVQFYKIDEISEEKLEFVVISTIFNGKWLYVRHKERKSWEIPGGHRENNEGIEFSAKRELLEETGAIKFILHPVCDIAIFKSTRKQFGRLFSCEIIELGSLPNSEICEVEFFESLPDNLTYPEVQPYLHKKILSLKYWE
ncbi:NUDIX hydrolase [Cytobacillus sp. IB215316]|uniref:NUDIX hydrolase n=1 Tax=Cytobacillus sp. IB215316 TaxID=3097354 RepID=UPI002A145954|nr:NUDIX domain-containing protein [Cytobacillus sp. IB215316]MDX8363473.1 NUDIX domain-containing protein [Cytobacillus sp. IB215316]